MARSWHAAERGQSTIELALCLPLVALLMAAVIEAAGLATDHVRVWHAAREAARVAVVDPDVSAIREAASAGGLDGLDLAVEPRPEERVRGEPLTVKVTYLAGSHLPLIRRFFAGITMHASATMRIERP